MPLDAAMARTDRLPLRVTLDGSGPLSGWQGQFHLLSGQNIHSDATISIAQEDSHAVRSATMMAPAERRPREGTT